MGPEMLARAWGTSAGPQDALVRFGKPRRLSPGGQWRDVCSGQKGQFVREDRSDVRSGNCEPSGWLQCEARGGSEPEIRLGTGAGLLDWGPFRLCRAEATCKALQAAGSLGLVGPSKSPDQEGTASGKPCVVSNKRAYSPSL